MKTQITDVEKYKVVSVSGEVDLSNSKELKTTLIEQLTELNNIIVDFSALDYIDSSGIASLVEAFNTAKSKQLEFHIAGTKGAPLQVLQLTRLDSVFSLAESVEQVVN